MKKASFIRHGLEISTMQSLLDGNLTRMFYTMFDKERNRFTRKLVNKRFNQFAVLCKQADCDSGWNAAFMGQTRFHRITSTHSRQVPFFGIFTDLELWSAPNANFAGISFAKFLGLFVQSGLYEKEVSHYQQFYKFERMKMLRLHFKSLGEVKNGSLFSYIFLANKNQDLNSKDINGPNKLMAFRGISIVGGFMLGVSLIALIFELIAPFGFKKRVLKFAGLFVQALVICFLQLGKLLRIHN